MVSKYQERWYCMVITMLLAFAMLIAVPLITAQAYAMEGDQPTETIYQDDIIINTNSEEGSDGSEDELTNDNDSQIDPSLDISEVIDTEEEIVEENINEEDEPFTEKENQVVPSIDTSELIDNDEDLLNEILSEEVELEVKTLGSSGPIWEVSSASELENALENFLDGDTIQLTKDIDYDKGIVIDKGKTITFDVGKYMLNVTSSTGKNYGVGLEVKEGGHVLLRGTGEFNVTQVSSSSGSVGVLARESSSAMVTNVICVSGIGVYASGDEAVIQVLGDVSATGVDGYGVRTWRSVQITIEGTLRANNYIIFNVETKGKDDGVEDSGMPGYLKYSYPEHGVVWIKKTTETVCEIDGTQYGTIDQALMAIGPGETKTIKLLQSVNQGSGIIINDGKKITFDLNNNTLNINNADGAGLSITDGTVDYIGEGEFNVSGSTRGVMVNGADAHATVTNVVAKDPEDGIGVYADNGAQVTVLGNVTAKIGADVKNEDTLVTIHGRIIQGEDATEYDKEWYVVVGYDNKHESWGAFKQIGEVIDTEYLVYTDAFGKSMVLVKADSSVPERNCAIRNYREKGFDLLYSELDAALYSVIEGMELHIELLKDIHYNKTLSVMGYRCVFDLNGHILNVNTTEETGLLASYGDVRMEGAGAFHVTGAKYGVEASNIGTYVTVTSATATDEDEGVGVYAMSGANITVLQDVSGKAYGIKLQGKANVTVGGNVFATGVGVGVNKTGEGTVTVEGSISADPENYLQLDINNMTESSGKADHGNAEKIGYLQYADYSVLPNFNLWVKNAKFYDLTVEGGIGTGSYVEGAHVFIQAAVPPAGMIFEKWITDGGGSFENENDATTIFTMPGENVTIKAIFEPVSNTDASLSDIEVEFDKNANDDLKVTLNSGSYTLKSIKNGSYTLEEGEDYTISGETVTIKASYLDTLEEGEYSIIFDMSGGTDPILTLTVIDTTNLDPDPVYTVTVKGSYAETTGAGNYAEGDTVNIFAGNRSGYTFTGWVSSDVTITDADNKNTSFTMPAKNVTVTANWSYNDSGSGSGGGSSSINATLSDIEVEYDKNENDDLKVTLKGGSYTLKSIKNSSYTLKEGKDYTISGGTVTFKASYLDSLKEGEYFLTFDMNGGKDPVLTVTVIDTTEEDTQEEILPVEETVYFEDVKATNWFYDAVNYVYNAGLMKGTSDTTFSPYVNTTRAMIVTILHRLEGTPKPITDNIFIDVEADKYYTDAVTWGKENKIVKGYGNDKFGPNDLITREQMAVILMNYADFKGYNVSIKADLNIFKDANQVSSWAQDGVAWANASELIIGKGEGILDPGSKTTRAEVATILERFVKNILK